MNLKNKIIVALISVVIIFMSIGASMHSIEKINNNYKPKSQIVDEKISGEENSHVNDTSDMMFTGIGDAKATALPVKYENEFTVYENELYVTNNKGQTWIKVLNNNEVGYAKINDYLDNISTNNIYVSKDKIAVVYGGKGSDNISIISEDSDTNYWGVGTISKTATHDLKKGYDSLYIDFVDGGEKGYIVAIRNKKTTKEEKLVYTSVNSGVTWDASEKTDEIYKTVLTHFKI
ncbi:MAG: hypothetical protein ACREV6_15955 [Clostridium sp.]|uniref:hypothetical protein n=1 Tax=Clostridium sp. TaxID=1506 RepID=UPI003D6D08FE